MVGSPNVDFTCCKKGKESKGKELYLSVYSSRAVEH